MVKTILKIDGMMCGMCEAHINDEIRKNILGAKNVKSSHTKGISSFVSEEAPDEGELKDAIGKTGYTVLSVTTQPYKKKLLGIF